MAPVTETLRFELRRVAAGLLMSRWVVGNPLFRALMHRRIRRKVRLVESGQMPPFQVTLENTSVCNAKCVMCPYPTMERDKIMMDYDLFLKGLRDAKELGVRAVQPQFFGEPLADKRLGERIRAAKATGLYVSVYSNGSLLTEDRARTLIESGLDELRVSIDSHQPEVYEKIRVGLSFKKVLANVKGMMALRRKLGRQNPVVWTMMVEFGNNHKEVRDYFRFWSRIVDRVNISRSHNWGGNVSVEGLTTTQDERNRFPCPSLWNQLVVNAQGEILPCCCDYEGKSLSLGNLKDITLRQAWEGEKMQELRRKHLARQFDQIPLCATCRPNDVW